ncbi:MAG: class I SAM-dependent methyltransferase [Peptoniphilaceae bacterium]
MKTIKINYKEVVEEVLDSLDLKNSICLDATCGRGYDSLNLIKRMREHSLLYCCDIQKEAIESTKKLLEEEGYYNFITFEVSHDKVFKKIDKNLDLIIYNLGYLPKSNKKIITRAKTTVDSISLGLGKLNSNGVIIVVSYLGHEGSYEERDSLEKFLRNLDQKYFKVEKREFFNQINDPPVVYLIGVR